MIRGRKPGSDVFMIETLFYDHDLFKKSCLENVMLLRFPLLATRQILDDASRFVGSPKW